MVDLSKLTEIELINNVKNNQCSQSFEEIVKRMENLFYNTVHKFHKKNPNSNLNDLLEDLYIVLNKCVEKYDTTRKAKFSTYCQYMTYWHCQNIQKENYNTQSYEHKDLDLINNNQQTYQKFEGNVNELNNKVYSILDELKDDRAKKIFKLRLEGGDGKGLNAWSNIAPEMNLSISGCILVFNRAKKYLYNRLSGEKQQESVYLQ